MADSIDDLLDGTLDDLKDMPEFKPFPAGLHKCTLKFTEKEVTGFKGMEIALKAIETVELPSGSTDAPVNAGDETSVFYFLKHSNPKVAELGQGKLKAILVAIKPAYPNAGSNRDLMKEADGGQFIVATGVRTAAGKNGNAAKSYTDIVEVMPA